MKPSLYAVAASLYLTEYTLYSNSSSTVLLNSAISESFDIPFAQAAYVGVAFLAGFCVALLPAGITVHRYPPMRAFHVSSVMLVVLGVAASLSPQFWVLIAIRFLQGVASAALAPQIFRIIRRQFYPDHHSAVLGTWGLVVSVSALASPLITAALNDAWGWRSFPYETVATTIAAVVLMALGSTARTTAEDQPPPNRSRGTAALIVGLGVAQVGIFLLTSAAGTALARIVLCVMAIAVGVTVIVICRRASDGPRPILYQSFLIVFVAGIATNVFTLSVMYFLQQLRSFDSYRSALVLVPMAFFAGLLPVLPWGRPGNSAKNTRLVSYGASLLIVTAVSLTVAAVAADDGVIPLLGSAAVMGCAMGLLWSPLAANVLTNSAQIPFDSSVYHYLRALGAAIGVSIGATVVRETADGTALFSTAATLVLVAGIVASVAARAARRAAPSQLATVG
ncbi:MFS transporter [Mycolicibacterium brisbanense]|uniref:Transporter, major facilitator family protein n=1 Tax=Mycolicibacterium brisbanense TaxID=146020 RepID=A0A100W0D9_9MYCO|nr:MFS transporter [Mycolicibacterium brisbanense]MCV7161737.1 MFS transporter [Mycolicibacterium brisbanense]GAS89246.1 transporter, major facilitator family protein [Mycolicibacterium brisbanense]